MGALKAPSPDGLQVGFCQKYWGIISKEVTSYVNQIFQGNKDIKDIKANLSCPRPKTGTTVSSYSFQTHKLVQCKL